MTLPARDPNAGTLVEPFRVVPGQGYIVNNKLFLISQEKFNQSEDIQSRLKQIYGQNARMATWEELRQDLTPSITQGFLNDIGLKVTQPGHGDPNLFVTRYGTEFDSSRGRWFFANPLKGQPKRTDRCYQTALAFKGYATAVGNKLVSFRPEDWKPTDEVEFEEVFSKLFPEAFAEKDEKNAS